MGNDKIVVVVGLRAFAKFCFSCGLFAGGGLALVGFLIGGVVRSIVECTK